MRAGGARRRRRRARSAAVEFDGDVSRSEIDDETGNEERRDAARATLEHFLMHLFDQRKATDPRSDDDAEAIAVFFLGIDPGVLDGHLRRGDGVVDEGVGLFDLFFFDPVCGVEAADFAGDLAGERGRIEFGDAADAGPPFEQTFPRRLVAHAEGRDHADAGDDDAALSHGNGDRELG